VLATIGEFERDLIRSRMTDGRKLWKRKLTPRSMTLSIAE
jgi:hypothetical protein